MSLVTLGTAVEVVMGQAPPSQFCNTDRQGEIFVKAGEFGEKNPSICEWTTSPLKMARVDDTLLCVVGATCGKTNIASFDCAIGRSVAAIRPIKSKIDKDFLYHFLSTQVKRLRDRSQGAAQGVITKEMVFDIELVLPPLAQQRRIAAILDKATEIKAKREQAIAKLDDLVASAFEECCSKSGKQTVEKIKNLVIKQKLVDRSDGNVWSLALDQIESNSGQVLSQVRVSKEKLGTSTYYFEPDVVLYSKLRPYLNKVVIPETCGYATTELVPLYCDKEKILPVFMAAYLRSSKFVNFANTNSAGAKMPRVMMDKFWDYEMTLPNLGMQRDFQQLSEKCIAMKQSLKECIDKQEQLIASLQHQAFTTGFNA